MLRGGVWLLFILVTVSFVRCFQQTQVYTLNDTATLSKDLLKGYDKNIRGNEDQTKPTTLSLQFYLANINSFDEVTGTFSVVGFFELFWKDSRMTWNTTSYNGVPSISYPQSDVWTPIILLANSHREEGILTLGGDWMQVRYIPQGTALWSPSDLFKSFCSPETDHYPYDTQRCELQFIPWGYLYDEIEFDILQQECILDLYSENGAWELRSTHLQTENIGDRLRLLRVKFVIRRRATFYLINMILPIAAMGVLNLFVFVLPPESGERISYSITLLLAISVFLTIASDNLPKTSYPAISFLCIKLLVDMLISSCVVLLTIMGLRFYHKDDNHSVPACIASITSCLLCRCCRRQQSPKPKRKVSQSNVSRSSRYIPEPKIPMPPYNSYANSNGGLPRIDIDDATFQEQMFKTDQSDTEKRITWTDVGKASDIVFFTFTFLAFGASHIAYIIFVLSR